MQREWDVCIIGRGPAGVSAALYTRRAGLSTLIIGRDGGALNMTDAIENYYGFEQPVRTSALLLSGERQAARLGVELLMSEVFGVRLDGLFTLRTGDGDFTSKAVILAAGRSRAKVKGLNLDEFEGRGVSYCAVCDGFFHRGKQVAVLGGGQYAMGEARELLHITAGVTLLTNGQQPEAEPPDGVIVDTRAVTRLTGGERLESVEFAEGEPLRPSALFVAVGSASATDIARASGLMLDGSSVKADADGRTNVPGLFAAGDCTGGPAQVAVAVGQGTRAGLAAIAYVRRKANAD